jgi:hypothetical protein
MVLSEGEKLLHSDSSVKSSHFFSFCEQVVPEYEQ